MTYQLSPQDERAIEARRAEITQTIAELKARLATETDADNIHYATIAIRGYERDLANLPKTG